MFDFVRNHSRLMLGLMVLLIFPSFVFFGVQGYSRFMSEEAAAVAKVDGRSITRGEWDAAHRQAVERARREMPGIDARLLDSPEVKRETLDTMLRERVLQAAALKYVLMPGDERLQRLFVSDPRYASLRNPDGSVNRELLASQGLSSEMFAAQLGQEYGMRQVLMGVGGSAFAPAAAASASLGALLQQREVQLQRFDAATYLAKVAPTDADIEAFYKANDKLFQAPEQARIEYVTLDLEALTRGMTLPEEDLRKYYAENASRYTAAEERRASHILVTADKDAPSADRQKARARAEVLLAQVRKDPKSFAEVARKNSQDPGSAAQGGDLDFFGRGSMVKPFEDAVFAMKTGEISNVVESDFGFHVIQLTALRGGEKKPFEAVRAEIEAEVRKALAQKAYAEAADQFSNTVYEQSDSLQPVVDKLKLEKRTALVQRTPAPGAQGALASAKFLEAVFGNEVVRNKRNTDAVEVAPNQLAAARILEHSPARVRPLAEVRDEVKRRVAASQAAALARQDGQKRLAEAQAAAAQAWPGAPLVVGRAAPQGLPTQVLDAVLGADPAKLPAALGVDLGEAGYAVARVSRILPPTELPGGQAPLVAQYAQAWGDAETRAYLEAMKKRFKAGVDEARAAAGAASSAQP